MVADRMHEVGFAQADASVYNQRIERRSAQRVRHRERRRAGKLIAFPFDIILKRITRIQ